MKNDAFSAITIIAEIGINHDGDFLIAKRLTQEASQSDVNAVKFQYRNLSNAYSDTHREIGDEILLNEIKKTYLPPSQIMQLVDYAHELNLQVGISFFDVSDIEDFGSEIDRFDFFKIPSVELLNDQLIDALMSFSKHLYLSLGAHSECEIEAALSRLPKDGWTPLHCVSNYPLSILNPQLGYISYLSEKWNRPIGYSSHDDNWEVCMLAMSMGASVIERHITLDTASEGLDHSSSSTPKEFKKLSMFAKNFGGIVQGNHPKSPNQGELLNRQNLGRSYFISDDVNKGEILSLEMLNYRSPNIGLNKTDIKEYVGKSFNKCLSKGAPVLKSHFDSSPDLADDVVDFCRSSNLALPIRLHDKKDISKRFPINSFELHLSYGEILSDIDVNLFSSIDRYSIHLPDYINSTQLMDPFSSNVKQKADSLNILDRTVLLAESLQVLTKKQVIIVGSFSVVHKNREEFFAEYSSLFSRYHERGIDIVPQWLPPIAWYFGGSVRLDVMNELKDVECIKKHDLSICLDACHMLLGRNYFDFDIDVLIDNLKPNINHIHIADAIGIDGEGLPFGANNGRNLPFFNSLLGYDCMKVVEVWQGHFDNGAGFYKALNYLYSLKQDD